MDKKDKDERKEGRLFAQIEGLKPVDPAALVDFKRAMTDRVIPEVVRVVEKRRLLAAESRRRPLKM